VVLQVADGSAEEFGRFLKQAFAASQLVGLCNDPCVSSDFRGRRESVVISLTETQSIGDGQVRLLGWYDNEWGFSARMLDMATRLSQRRF
jgi:glyceraldehyde 3-phosphate dehydrogenase